MELKVLGLKVVCWVQWTFPTEFKPFLSSSLNQSFFLLSKKCKDCSHDPCESSVSNISERSLTVKATAELK